MFLIGLNAAYSGDNYGISVAYANVEAATASGGTKADSTYWGVIGSYSFDGGPLSSVSIGYGTGETEGSSTDSSSWFAGLMFDEVGPGKVCLLYTSPSPRDPTSSRMPSSA